MKLAIFASGNGSNFQTIAEAIEKGQIAGEICFLFCDKKEAFVIQRAELLGISVINFSPKEFPTKEDYEQELLMHLKDKQIDLIVLAGYMRIIGPIILTAYSGRMINIHPSLLPNFPGRHGIKDAYLSGVKETGVTVHYIDAGIDTGPIIAQERVPITSTDTLETLERKIHQVEHYLYPKVLEELTKTGQGGALK